MGRRITNQEMCRFFRTPGESLNCTLLRTLTNFLVRCSPHTLGAEDLYKAHLTPHLQEAQSTLNKKLETTHAENAELAQTVQAQRLEIEKLLSHLESVVTDVEGAATAATQFGKDNDIRQNAVQMDEEVNAQANV